MALAVWRLVGVQTLIKLRTNKMTYRPTLFNSTMESLLVYYSSQSQSLQIARREHMHFSGGCSKIDSG